MNKCYSGNLKLILVLPMIFLLGCSDAYGTAAKLAQDVAISVNQASSTIEQLRLQGDLSAVEESNILGYLNSLNTIDAQYIVCVQAAHGQSLAGGFTKCTQSLVVGMGDPATLAALRVSSPASQAKVVAIASGIVTLATVTITALGGK